LEFFINRFREEYPVFFCNALESLEKSLAYWKQQKFGNYVSKVEKILKTEAPDGISTLRTKLKKAENHGCDFFIQDEDAEQNSDFENEEY
jgi:hypothetical protein